MNNVDYQKLRGIHYKANLDKPIFEQVKKLIEGGKIAILVDDEIRIVDISTLKDALGRDKIVIKATIEIEL